MTPTDFDGDLMEQLAGPSGQELLAALPPYDESSTLSLTTRLRAQGWAPELIGAALTQSRLRARGRDRLGPGIDRLLLTPDGLEQATRPMVSRRHATRFLAAGVSRVWDLGCGLGLDSVGFAEAGLAVRAVERDARVAAAARSNLSPYADAEVMHADLTDVHPGPGDGVWFDPARRTPGVADITGRTRRVWRLAEISPGWEHVQEVAGSVSAAGAKLSPGFRPQDLPVRAAAEWVSVDGEVVECVVWWGRAVEHPGVRAAVARDGVWHEVRPVEQTPAPLAPGEEPGPYLAEPDRALLSAGLAGTAAALAGGRELDEGVGYLSAGAVTDQPWLRWYEVDEVLPLHARSVRSWLRDRGKNRVTLKKRGVSTDPDRFRKELRLKGGGPSEAEATLVLTRVGGRPQALVVRAVDRGEPVQ